MWFRIGLIAAAFTLCALQAEACSCSGGNPSSCEVPVADIVATRALRCLVLPASQLEGFLIAHPRVMYRLLQGEARKLKHTTTWLS